MHTQTLLNSNHVTNLEKKKEKEDKDKDRLKRKDKFKWKNKDKDKEKEKVNKKREIENNLKNSSTTVITIIENTKIRGSTLILKSTMRSNLIF